MSDKLSRRTFVKGSLAGSAGLAVGAGAISGTSVSAAPAPPKAECQVPSGKLGEIECGRLMLGGNLLIHYAHSRDLKYVYNLAAHYNTERKIIETVIEACEKNKVNCDFYIKTLHHHKYPSAKLEFDSMWSETPEKTIEFMQKVDKPWIAFKVMAAGAIPPKDAFQYSYENGADFVLAGMFDFEVAEDARVAAEILATDSVKNRKRPWIA